jgi:hypothetical protein
MEDEVRYYLPSSLVKNVIRAFWSASHLSKFYEDVDYKRMMDQLGRREKIFLLELPWERPFTLVDMKEQLDLELLVGFYQDMVIGNSNGRIDEIDTLESWLNRLSKYTDTKNDFHLVLALKYSQDAHEHSKPIVVGGLVFEYYHSENCGLLTYLQVPHERERGQRMAQALIDYAIETLDMDARLHGNLAGCNVLFMEIPNYNTEGNDYTEVQESFQKVISHSLAHTHTLSLISVFSFPNYHRILAKRTYSLSSVVRCPSSKLLHHFFPPVNSLAVEKEM